MSKLRKYSVWHYMQEQWDPDDIDEPALRCEANSPIEAAEKLADDGDDRYGSFIVRDDASGVYRAIELVRGWTVKRDAPSSLEDLCAP